jgi:hypothetical protein
LRLDRLWMTAGSCISHGSGVHGLQPDRIAVAMCETMPQARSKDLGLGLI